MKYAYIILFVLLSLPLFANPANHNQKEASRIYMYGVAYQAEGEWEKARNHYEYAIKLYPYDERFYSALSYLYFDRKEYQKAIAVLTKAIQIFPKNVDFLYHRAFFYTMSNAEHLALADWNTIITREPNNTYARWQRGQYYLKHQQYQRAKEDFANLARHDSHPSRIANFYLARTHQALGEYDEAVKQLQIYVQATETQPHNPYHPVGKAYFHLAHNLRLAGKISEASIYYSKAIDAKFWPDVTSAQRVEAQKYSNHSLNIIR